MPHNDDEALANKERSPSTFSFVAKKKMHFQCAHARCVCEKKRDRAYNLVQLTNCLTIGATYVGNNNNFRSKDEKLRAGASAGPTNVPTVHTYVGEGTHMVARMEPFPDSALLGIKGNIACPT